MPTSRVVAASAATRRAPIQPETDGNIAAIASGGLAKASLPDIPAIASNGRSRASAGAGTGSPESASAAWRDAPNSTTSWAIVIPAATKRRMQARLGPCRRHRDALIDRREMLELGLEATHRRQRRLGAGQRVKSPKQQMDAMHDRHAGLRAAGEDGVEVHRVAVAGNGGEPRLIGLGEGSFR